MNQYILDEVDEEMTLGHIGDINVEQSARSQVDLNNNEGSCSEDYYDPVEYHRSKKSRCLLLGLVVATAIIGTTVALKQHSRSIAEVEIQDSIAATSADVEAIVKVADQEENDEESITRHILCCSANYDDHTDDSLLIEH